MEAFADLPDALVRDLLAKAGDSRQPLFGAKGAPAIGFQVHCRHLQPRPSSQCHRERGSRNLRGEVCCFTARSRLAGRIKSLLASFLITRFDDISHGRHGNTDRRGELC
jgi:hypothetical protein